MHRGNLVSRDVAAYAGLLGVKALELRKVVTVWQIIFASTGDDDAVAVVVKLAAFAGALRRLVIEAARRELDAPFTSRRPGWDSSE